MTSVTTGRPEVIDTPPGRHSYRHVQMVRFNGFEEVEVSAGQHAFVAGPKKALLDLIYLTPGSDHAAYLAELRLVFSDAFDWALLEALATGPRSRKLQRAVNYLAALFASGGWSEL